MSRARGIGPPALERAVDELARRGRRFEVYAKAGETLDWRVRYGLRERRRVREVGVACRVFEDGAHGFAAAAGSAAVSGRDAARAALANLVRGGDPLPPRSYLGSVEVPPPPDRVDPPACEALLAAVERQLGRAAAAVEVAEVRLLAGNSETTIVTGDGFAARAAAGACILELLLGAPQGPLRLFQAASRTADDLDGEGLARAAAEATLLTARGSAPSPGLVDVLAAPPVAASLVVGLAEFVLGGGLEGAEPPPRVSSIWELVDERAGPAGLVPLPFDGEGLPSKSVVVAAGGRLGGRLATWAAACRGEGAAGGAVRPSYRHPPFAGPANLVFTAANAIAPAGLLDLLGDGIYAPLSAGPLRIDNGRFALPVAAVRMRHGRAAAAHPIVELRGTFRRLLSGLAGAGGDARGFSLSCSVVVPSLLIRKLELA